MPDRSPLEILAVRLEARGADIGRWPADEAAQARALLAISPDAQVLVAEASRFDAMIARAAEAEIPNGLAFRIVADVAARRTDRFEWLVGSPRRLGFAGASFGAAAVAVGMLIGAVAAPQTGDYSTASGDLGPGFAVAIADYDL